MLRFRLNQRMTPLLALAVSYSESYASAININDLSWQVMPLSSCSEKCLLIIGDVLKY